MSRLIDADVLLEKGIYSERAIEMGGRDIVLLPLPDVMMGIANAPTVEAIPIEWLRKWPKDLRMGAVIRDIIQDWRKEQEAKQ